MIVTSKLSIRDDTIKIYENKKEIDAFLEKACGIKTYSFYYIDTYYTKDQTECWILKQTITAINKQMALIKFYKSISFDKMHCKILKTECDE